MPAGSLLTQTAILGNTFENKFKEFYKTHVDQNLSIPDGHI